MSIERKKILSSGNDINITIALGNANDMYGYEQENNDLLNKYGNDLTNKPIDYEIRRFEYRLPSGFIRFYFNDDGNYGSNFNSAGFDNTDIYFYSNAFRNSFFIMEIYDDYNQYTQNKLFSGYLTKFNGESTTFNELKNKSFQLNKIQIPIHYLDDIEDDIVFLYASFKFYNAKTGKLQNFYNYNYSENNTPINQYYKIKLIQSDMKWNFISKSNQNITNINLREFILSTAYNERINNTLKSIDDREQKYPDKNTFDANSGTYV